MFSSEHLHDDIDGCDACFLNNVLLTMDALYLFDCWHGRSGALGQGRDIYLFRHRSGGGQDAARRGFGAAAAQKWLCTFCFFSYPFKQIAIDLSV
ncbi:hypothetical protein Q4S45_21010 [Massilia sp. R2A-15]|uniref:hypothetical protein n=1 Tax=Massilia sp. R2A-15 TaxID=3064278 RepID=UPI002733BD78|nr:hypothetical protein [Massilia sp. R2A-15]WLI89146.1 hypothetical protein Q4S45_21010 [Massilia sp. R2A-15]